MALQLEGKDNYGKPRQEFADRIAGYDEKEYLHHTETIIWLSAFANNNRRSDYHWQAVACFDEAARRGKPELYTKAYNDAVASAAG
jgi:hypothetical protein